MTPSQNEHRAYIVKEAAFLINEKYAKGAAEHDSHLKDDYTVAGLLDNAIEEAIDQITYLLTMKQKMEEENGLPKISKDS